MKINFAQTLTDLEGNPIKDNEGKPILFSKQIGNLIFQTQDKDNPLSSYELAKKIYSSTCEVDFTTSEIEKIKGKIKEGFNVGFAGQALEIIASSDNDPKPIGGGGGGSAKPPKDE